MDALDRVLWNTPTKSTWTSWTFRRSSTSLKRLDPFARNFFGENFKFTSIGEASQIKYIAQATLAIPPLVGALAKLLCCRKADLLHHRTVLTVPWSRIPDEACISRRTRRQASCSPRSSKPSGTNWASCIKSVPQG